MKMVIKICLVQQMTKKFAVKVDAKIRFGKKCKNLQVSLFNEDVKRLPHQPGKLHDLI